MRQAGRKLVDRPADATRGRPSRRDRRRLPSRPGNVRVPGKVVDNAGNTTVSNRRRDGRVEVLEAPFRLGTRMTAGIVKPGASSKPQKVSAACRRSQKCMAKVRRQRSAARKRQSKQSLPSGTAPSMTVPYGKSALVKGMLRTSDGRSDRRSAGRRLPAARRLRPERGPDRDAADERGRRVRLPRPEGRQPNDPVPVPRHRHASPRLGAGEAARAGELDAQGRAGTACSTARASASPADWAPGGRRSEDRRTAGVLPRQVAHVRDPANRTPRGRGATGTASRRRAVSCPTSSESGSGERRATPTSSATRG